MIYETNYYYAPRFKYANRNQHGTRYKKINSKQINVVALSCERTNTSDLEDLVVLSHTLNVPVHYDFKTNRAYIKLMSAEAVKKL